MQRLVDNIDFSAPTLAAREQWIEPVPALWETLHSLQSMPLEVFFAEKRAVNFDGTNTNTSRPSVEADGKRPSFLLPPYLLDPVALSLRICCSKKKKKKGGGEAVKPV